MYILVYIHKYSLYVATIATFFDLLCSVTSESRKIVIALDKASLLVLAATDTLQMSAHN